MAIAYLHREASARHSSKGRTCGCSTSMLAGVFMKLRFDSWHGFAMPGTWTYDPCLNLLASYWLI